jgi:protein-tyrosine phosphatase
MIDLHCHVLPGVDDGPATMQEVLALVRGQEAAGVTTVLATSHVSYEWPRVDAAMIAQCVATVQSAIDAEGVALRIVPGAEVALTRAMELEDSELSRLHLGSGPWLLLEPPHVPVAGSALESVMVTLMHRGHKLLIAHPERCATFHSERDVLERMVAAGAMCSVTASSLSGNFGRTVQSFAMGLVGDGLVHNVASDAHGGMSSRAPGILEHLRSAGMEPLATWLTEAVPEAVLAGTEVPERPPFRLPERPRGLLSRLRGR